jgi:hypothetical protein
MIASKSYCKASLVSHILTELEKTTCEESDIEECVKMFLASLRYVEVNRTFSGITLCGRDHVIEVAATVHWQAS